MEKDEPEMHVVGRRRRPSALSATSDSKANAIAWRNAFPTPFVPRGVYRFASHEDADRWMQEMLARPRQP